MRKPWEYEEPLCAEVGVEIFFARDVDDTQRRNVPLVTTYTEAKKVCQSCVHVSECAEWGIRNEEHGVWGGLSPVDRRNMRSRYRIPIEPRVNIIR